MSPFRYHLVPIFTDNYVFVVENSETRRCVVVDPGSAVEVVSYLKEQQLILEAFLLTHHHSDHIDGIGELLKYQSALVYAPEKNRNEIPGATEYVKEGRQISAIGLDWNVLDLPGHTLGHIGYLARQVNWLFSGDVLFGLGCGRLFEGTFQQQFDSLAKIKNLNPSTKVFCTHEYTERNLAFCNEMLLPSKKLPQLSAPDLNSYEVRLKQLRGHNTPSVPLDLKSELKCNPFLLAKDVGEFTEVRQMRNRF